MAQENLFTDISENLDKGPVICLGKTFNSEEERRAYYRNELRTKLPELKTIEGFPIGEDEDIINLSDPPYYTACPNPWLNDFIAEWEKEKENIKGRNPDFHVDEPYASDVSVGKNNPIYNAHSYHTKVPHPAIMRYILHYTQPGDIVFDGFAGTGMTGVASSKCGHPEREIEFIIESEWKKMFGSPPVWGVRRNITSDLSPIASFISHNYNKKSDLNDIKKAAENIFDTINKQYGWFYETTHSNGQIGVVNYFIWSEVFSCHNCNNQIVFWEEGINHDKGEVMDSFLCPKCKIETSKSNLDRLLETSFDIQTNQAITQPKYKVVLINYKVNGKKFEKKPDNNDLLNIEKINNYELSDLWFPKNQLPNGDKTNDPIRFGYINVHHFYTKRNLIILSAFWNLAVENSALRLLATSILVKTASLLHNVGIKKGKINLAGALPNAIYIPSTVAERNLLELLSGKLNDFLKVNFNSLTNAPSQVASATDLKNIQSKSIDYIFVDPPFGANIMYSELNFLQEAWLKVFTKNEKEAIENRSQGKKTLDYQDIMTICFNEFFRILKDGKWMTVEFSNTNAAVWNGIQTSIQRAGFVIANVSALDKQQGSFNAQTSPTAVKQDLAISCYKPSEEFERKFKIASGDIAVWDFIQEHLQHLPVHLIRKESTASIIERSPKILYDRLITFYLMRGLTVPIDARDFQQGLKQRFIERDGMYFTAEQAAEYDEKKAKTPIFVQLSLIVTNESDAIEWLKERLRKQAQKYQDIMPDFRIATQSLRKGDSLPELQDILNESFIQEADGKWRTPDPNEAKDREALRTKVLLKEFTGYVTAINQPKAKKLKEVRVEALRAGFKNSWEQKDFKTIVTLGDKIPQNILLEDEQLLMYYDIAKDRE